MVDEIEIPVPTEATYIVLSLLNTAICAVGYGKFNYLISYTHNFNRANSFEISDAAEI